MTRPRAPKTSGQRAGVLVFVAVACSARSARAAVQSPDDVELWGGRAGPLIHLLPSEIGMDSGLQDGEAVPRFRIGWSYQLPFCWVARAPQALSIGRLDCKGDDALMRHRIVFSVRLAIGSQRVPVSGQKLLASLDGRVGYRYRFAHADHRLVPYFGAGSTLEIWRDGSTRASISPELGVHMGKEASVFPPGFMLGWQADAYLVHEPRFRVMALVAYSFL